MAKTGWVVVPSLHPEDTGGGVSYGGVLLYIREVLLPHFIFLNTHDNSFVDIISFRFFDIVFLICYVPPITSRFVRYVVPSPLDVLLGLMSSYCVQSELVVVGDLNAHMGVWMETDYEPPIVDMRGRILLEALRMHDILIVNGTAEGNTGYTFLRGQSRSCLDYVFCTRNIMERD